MKIYLISIDDWGYDSFSDFVIAANSEDEVRGIAMDAAGDEGKAAWQGAEIKEIGIYTGESLSPVIISESFHAG